MLIRRLLLLAAGVLPLLLTGQVAAAESALGRMDRDFQEARQITAGKGATIAVLSTGIAAIPSLRGRIAESVDLTDVKKSTKTQGTLTASALSKLAPDAKLLSVRIEPDVEDFADREKGFARWWDGADQESLMNRGIRWAADHGADVIWINDNWERADLDMVGNPRAIDLTVDYAVGKGAVIVVAVGRFASAPDQLGYPAAAPGVVGVATVDSAGRRDAKESAANRSVLLAAPGTKRDSLGPDGETWTSWGKWVASPYVAGAAALVRAKYPDLSPALVGQALAASARRPSGGAAYDTSIGFGVVNPRGALEEAGRLAAMKPGKGTVPVNARFGEPVRRFAVVKRDDRKIAMLGATTGAGALLLVAGLAGLGLRRRAKARAASSA